MTRDEILAKVRVLRDAVEEARQRAMLAGWTPGAHKALMMIRESLNEILDF